MSATASTRRRREAKPDPKTGAEHTEATAEELAAQADRPSNEQAVAETNGEPVLGQFGALPSSTGNGGSGRPTHWTDKLNNVADHQVEAGLDQWAFVHETGTPRTANSVASDLRKKLKNGAIPGIVEGGSFEVVTRGKRIFARFVPAPAPAGE